MPARTARSALVAITAAAVIAASGAAPASAGELVRSAPDCSWPDSSQVFAPWGDPAWYFLAPDGGLEEGGGGWQLDGASVADANEPYEVGGPGSKALQLPSGAAGSTPTVCVGLEHPTMRFFARKLSGSPYATLRVDAMVEDGDGDVYALPVGVLRGSSSWQPGPPMFIAASLLPLLTGSYTPVEFRFTARNGDYQVDDVYIDPYGSR